MLGVTERQATDRRAGGVVAPAIRRLPPLSTGCALSLIFVAAIVIQLLGFQSSVSLYDGGLIAFGAERVKHGDVPYRDFWTIYGPAQFYVVSFGGMVLFGGVLERFFALYCAPNHFTRLTLRGRQLEQEIARWPARAGEALVI